MVSDSNNYSSVGVEAKRKRKKLMYIGGAVAVVGIASYFIFKKK